MTLIRVEPHDYVTTASLALASERRVRNSLTSAQGSLGRCYNMAGSDDGGEKFAAAYDDAAAHMLANVGTLADSMHSWARAMTACGQIHASADRFAAGLSLPAPGFTDPGAGAMMCYASPPTSSGGNSQSIPGLEWVIDKIGYIWPDADTGKLRTAGSAWDRLGDDLTAMSNEVRSWTGHLAGVTSPERNHIQESINDLANDISSLAKAVGGDTESLASACNSYAQQVDDAHHQARIMLRDLLIEIAAGAAVSVALSFVTFGAAGAVGGAAIAARIAWVATNISTKLASLLEKAYSLASKIHSALVKVRALKAWAELMAKGTRLTKVTYAFADNALGGTVAAFFTTEDTNPLIAGFASGTAGVFGDLLTGARYFDNFAGKTFSGTFEGAIEYGISESLSGRELTVAGAVLSAGAGGVGGAARGGFDAAGGAIGKSIDADLNSSPLGAEIRANTNESLGLKEGPTATTVDGAVQLNKPDAVTVGGGNTGGVTVDGSGVSIHADAPTGGSIAAMGAALTGGGPSTHASNGPDVDADAHVDVHPDGTDAPAGEVHAPTPPPTDVAPENPTTPNATVTQTAPDAPATDVNATPTSTTPEAPADAVAPAGGTPEGTTPDARSVEIDPNATSAEGDARTSDVGKLDAYGRPETAPEGDRGPEVAEGGVEAAPGGEPVSEPAAGLEATGFDSFAGADGTHPVSDAGADPGPTGKPDPLLQWQGQPTYTNSEGHDFGDRVWRETIENLSPEQRQAIVDYTKELGSDRLPGEIDYTDINKALRTGEGLENPHIAQTIQRIQQALETNPTPRDLTVVRGMNLKGEAFAGSPVSPQDLIGKTIVNESFTSTTLGDTPPGFADLNQMNSVVHLDVPANTPALFIDSISANKGEGELLLGKGLRMEIIDAVEDAQGRWHVYARVVAGT